MVGDQVVAYVGPYLPSDSDFKQYITSGDYSMFTGMTKEKPDHNVDAVGKIPDWDHSGDRSNIVLL